MGDEGIIMKTVNGGSTWTSLSSGTSDDFYSVSFLNADKGYVVAWEGDILKTLDGGLNWINDSSGTRNPLYSVFFTDSTTGYVVGDGGTILKMGNGGTTSVAEHKKAGTGFTLYPNPATDKITIETAATQPNSQLSITDLNGQEVLTCQINQRKTQINIATLPAGVYFVRLTNVEATLTVARNSVARPVVLVVTPSK